MRKQTSGKSVVRSDTDGISAPRRATEWSGRIKAIRGVRAKWAFHWTFPVWAGVGIPQRRTWRGSWESAEKEHGSYLEFMEHHMDENPIEINKNVLWYVSQLYHRQGNFLKILFSWRKIHFYDKKQDFFVVTVKLNYMCKPSSNLLVPK